LLGKTQKIKKCFSQKNYGSPCNAKDKQDYDHLKNAFQSPFRFELLVFNPQCVFSQQKFQWQNYEIIIPGF